MEWTILGMGLIGVVCLYYVFPEKWWKIYISGFGLGLTFEAFAERLFDYHPQLRDRHCIGRSDVNLLFPVAWLEICALAALFAEKLWNMNLFAGYLVGALIAGNINEFIFYKFHFWQYNYDEKLIGNIRPFKPKITVSGVPVQVIIGYWNIGIMVYVLCHILH